MPRPSLLLIDADARSSRVLEVSLKKAGFAVATAGTAADALAAAFANPPELVITETSLPDSDGYELCARLRRDARTTRAGIIFLSADASAEAKVKGINAGADEFLNKPVLVMEIVSRVRGLLERRETEEVARRERPGNMSGSLAHMGVVDLIQLMETGAKTGIVHLASDAARSGGFVARGEQRATLYFRDGQVIDASLGKLVGAPAVFRALMWEDGVFEVEFKPLAREDVVCSSTQSLLLEGMRRVDEWARARELLPPLDTKLVVDLPTLAAHYRELPDHLRGVVPLFDGRRGLFEAIDDAQVDDLEALAATVELHRSGVLQPSDRPASTLPRGDTAAADTWTSLVPGSAPGGASDDLPSVLARAMIPASNPSEIIRAADPRPGPDDFGPTPHGGSAGEHPIPLTQPNRERTPLPEPLPEDSVILSRHTVPANRAVPLTTSKPSGPATLEGLPFTTGDLPIPLTNPVQRQLPRLTLQRMSSTVPRPTAGGVAGGQDPSAPTLDGWTPVSSSLSGGFGTPSGLPADSDPTVRDFSATPAQPAAAVARAAGSSITAAATVSTRALPGALSQGGPASPVNAPVALDAHANGSGADPGTASSAPAPAQPARPSSVGAQAPRSLALDETERVVRTRGERAISVVIAPQAAARPSAALPIQATPEEVRAEVQARDAAATPTPAPLPATPEPAGALPSRPAAVAATPTPRPTPSEDAEDSFFAAGNASRGSDDALEWESPSNRGRNLLLIGLLVAAAVGVVVAPGLVKQRVEKAPETPSKAKQAALAKKSAAWPTVDESKIQVGDPAAAGGSGSSTAARAAEPSPATAAQPTAAPAETAKALSPDTTGAKQPAAAEAKQPAAAEAKQPAAAEAKQPAAAEAKQPAAAEAKQPAAAEAKAAAPAGDGGLLVQAEALLKSDRLKEAEAKFRAAVTAQPSSAAAHSGLAMALYGLEKDAPAAAEAKKAIGLDPNSARAHLVVGLIASNRQDIAGAKKAYRRYLELEPRGVYAEEVRRFMKAQQ